MSDTKRLLVWLFMVIWCVLSLAFDVRAQGTIDLAANTIIIKKKAAASAAAGGGSGYVGNEVTTGEANGIPPSMATMYRIQATATGSLSTAHLYHIASANGALCKIGIYGPSNNADPNSDTTEGLIGQSSEITATTSAGWFTAAITGSVTSGSYYWVLVTTSGIGAEWEINLGSSSEIWYIADWSANYATFPASLGTGWSDLGAYGPLASYCN